MQFKDKEIAQQIEEITQKVESLKITDGITTICGQLGRARQDGASGYEFEANHAGRHWKMRTGGGYTIEVDGILVCRIYGVPGSFRHTADVFREWPGADWLPGFGMLLRMAEARRQEKAIQAAQRERAVFAERFGPITAHLALAS